MPRDLTERKSSLQMKKPQKPPTKWHELLGTLFKYLLSPVDILVSTGFSVMSKSPEVDILLLRRSLPQWTAEQLALLPDGIRDCQASDILLEFKYTESFNENALQQALSYDLLYKQHKKNHKDVQTFLLISRKTSPKTLTRFGYEGTSIPGVYRSQFELVRKIVLISLNELKDEPHNAFIKCFASYQKEKQKAFSMLKQMDLSSFTTQLQWFIVGLKAFWFSSKKGDRMKIEMTPQMVTEMGKEWGEVCLSAMPAKERLAGLTPAEIFAGFTPAERLAGLKPAEILAEFKPTEILAEFKPTERLAGLKPAEILAEFKPTERLAGLKPAEILAEFKPTERLVGLTPQQLDELAAYLNQRRQPKNGNG